MNNAPSTHQMAVGRVDVVRLFPPEGSIGLGNDIFPGDLEGQAFVADIDDHVVAFVELAFEYSQR
jgi:hypothetical protein